MLFTWELPSKRFQISKADLKRILFTFGLIVIPVLTYIVWQLSNWLDINWATALWAGCSTLLVMLQQFLQNNQKDEWPITVI